MRGLTLGPLSEWSVGDCSFIVRAMQYNVNVIRPTVL